MRGWVVSAALFALSIMHSDHGVSAPADVWQSLSFLEGTWEAHTQGGSANAQVRGTYTFERELKNHVLARHGSPAGCKGPDAFDCQHSDLLYVYEDADGPPLKAIYFDNEGHVIHYTVSTPDSTTATFVSEASSAGPQFQLVYQLTGEAMSGKFQMRMPGQTDWKSYLEWSGSKK